jgi:two-component sensor histidine kinase
MPEIIRPITMPATGESEADHRIANNLSILSSFIKLQASEVARSKRPFGPAEVSALLEEMAVRVDTTAKLHMALLRTANEDQVSIDDFLGEICALLSALYHGDRVSILADCICGENIEAGKALPIGLAAIEMITNAAKYAHPTGLQAIINVSSRRTNNSALIEVSDDGIGLPEGFDPSKDGGVGFRLMRSLAKQIQAELHFTNDALGTSCTLIVPGVPKTIAHPWPAPNKGHQTGNALQRR